MSRTIAKAATIVALCLSLGWQWAALQSVAWTAMLMQNARHAPLLTAVAQTFDGAHPCSLCHAAAAGEKSQKSNAVFSVVAKMDLICTTRRFQPLPPERPYDFPSLLVIVGRVSYAPPTPPPRAALS